VEREKGLGGNLLHIHYSLEGDDVASYLKSLVKRIESNNVHVFTNSEVEKVEGFIGNFKTTIKNREGGQTSQVEHGIVIVATGGKEYKPTEYLYGANKNVITQQELEGRLAGAGIRDAENIVMIQCVGSREPARPYCSRVCCGQAVKNALKLKELNKDANIFILYRDMRTYGLKEDYYRKAREQGVNFIRYEVEAKPEVTEENGRLKVSVLDPVLGRKVVLRPDLLVLSAATIPEANEELARMLKVPLTREGFFLEAHLKLRPVDFATDGIFLCGLAHSPKYMDECIAQANAAVSRAVTILSKDKVQSEGIVSFVNELVCRGCGTCKEICEFGAIELMDRKEGGPKVSNINPLQCKGCGACAAACPSSAITVRHFSDKQLITMLDAALEEPALVGAEKSE
jgi:heterodisulfide reductase subunit A